MLWGGDGGGVQSRDNRLFSQCVVADVVNGYLFASMPVTVTPDGTLLCAR